MTHQNCYFPEAMKQEQQLGTRSIPSSLQIKTFFIDIIYMAPLEIIIRAKLAHGGQKRQQIWPRTYNFLSLVWNITKLPLRIELNIPKNRMFFVFRFCYILAGK
jgi:hypothetical protein